jgi:hypothetical protein
MKLKLSVDLGKPPTGWNGAVEAVGGTVFHSSYWAEFQRQVQGCEPVFIQARDETGELLGVALALYRRSRHPVLGRLLRSMEMPAYPAAAGADPAVGGAILAEAERAARKVGCARLSVHSNFSGGAGLALSPLGYTTRDRVEFLVDLTSDADTLWKAIKKDQRERIRRLERDGIQYEATSAAEGMEQLHAVRQTALERRLERDQGFDLPPDLEYYGLLYRTLVEPGAARLLIARQEGDVVAAILYATFAHKAYSVFSGSTEAGYKLSAQTGLFWFAVTTFKQDGYRLLNRGGVPAEAEQEGHELHGIYRFKHRLGTTPARSASGEKVLSPVKDRFAKLRELIRGAET